MRHHLLMPVALASAMTAAAAPAPDALPLAGTWIMELAYEVLADGSRVTNYGPHPDGLMMIDSTGRYSIQIYRRDRPNFKSGIKSQGEPNEYRTAVLGSSTHFGRVSADVARRQLVFEVEGASFPNWQGQRQVRNYSYRDGVLTYAVPASASGIGTVAWSVWKKVDGPVRAAR